MSEKTSTQRRKDFSNARGVSKRMPAVQAGGSVKSDARSNPSYDELVVGLNESLRLQSHYAGLLNLYDAGERKQFPTIESWLARLREMGTLKKLAGGTPAAR